MLARAAAALVALALASPAVAAKPAKSKTLEGNDFPTTPCSGTVKGAVSGSFTCKASVRKHSDAVRFSFTPVKLPKGATAFMLGDIEVVAPRAGQSYPLPTLAGAQMFITNKKHQRFVVAKVVPQPKRGETNAPPPTITGELTLKVDTLETKAHEAAAATGTVTARLVPSDPKVKGDVTLTLKF